MTTDRNRSIAARRIAGDTLEAIGADYGITRERVRQILTTLGVPADTARQARQARRAEERVERGAQVRRLLAAGPKSRHEIARTVGCPVREVTDLAGNSAHLILDGKHQLAAREKSPYRRYTDADICAAIRAAADANGNPLASITYQRWAEGQSVPSLAVISNRMGWKAACRAAGVTAAGAGRGVYTRRWSPAVCIGWVTVFLVDGGRTYAEFDRWLRTRPGAPSSATVRNITGLSWSALKAAAWPPQDS